MSTLKNLSFKGDGHGNISFNDVSRDVEVSISSYNFATFSLDFHQAKKLCWWLKDWMDNEQENCRNGCDHERSGCQYHEARQERG